MARKKYRKPLKLDLAEGTFTAWCKRQGFGSVTQECIAAGLKSKSAAIRKKANFAKVARKWKR